MGEKRILQLDGLRFFAVFMVLIAHWLQWKISNSAFQKIPFSHGVTLFFVLSGFLITEILLKNRDVSLVYNKNKWGILKSFYLRRFLRIFPIYYLLIFALFIINYQNTRQIFPFLVSYTLNIYQSIHIEFVGNFNHFWSLAVEEQFYLFWPFLILFTKPKYTGYFILISIFLSLLVRILLFYYTGNWMAMSYFTFSCMHALSLGALLAFTKLFYKKVFDFFVKKILFYLSWFIYIFLLVLQISENLILYRDVFDEFVFALAATSTIAIASVNGFNKIIGWILELKITTYLGKISYGIYVYHLFIPSLFLYLNYYIGISEQNKYFLFVTYFVLTIFMSSFSWYFIESPLNGLKRFFPYNNIDRSK